MKVAMLSMPLQFVIAMVASAVKSNAATARLGHAKELTASVHTTMPQG